MDWSGSNPLYMDLRVIEMSDERDQMLEIIWREKRPEIIKPVDETIPMYNIAEIYDNPGRHMTVRGMFRYTKIDVVT